MQLVDSSVEINRLTRELDEADIRVLGTKNLSRTYAAQTGY